MSSMANVLGTAKRVQIVSALVEGVGIRATARMAGVSKDTVMKLWVKMGEACARYQDESLRDLRCRRLQVDEVWSFVYAKQKNIPQDRLGKFGVGDVWTFTAIDAETKLIPSFLIGSRDTGSATAFLQDLAGRLVNRVQLTTDGHKMYLSAAEDAFHGSGDFAQLVKIYGADSEGEKRYSPAVCLGCERTAVVGQPDPRHVSTSHVERSNLAVHMSVRRFTRLTNAFSKKLLNHAAAIALYTARYNFIRIHQTLRCTPAMAAVVANRPWSIEDLVALLPAVEHVGGGRGPSGSAGSGRQERGTATPSAPAELPLAP
jgi:IS1 family transposase